MNDKALVKLEEATTSLKRQNFHPSRELAITLVGAAHHALLTAKSNGDTASAHEVRKQLKTIEDWFKLQRARLIDSNLVVAERLRAERVVGGMLANGDKHKGGRGLKNPLHNVTGFPTRRDQLHWNREAQIADANFEQWVIDQTQDEQEISTAALLRLWREEFGESPEAQIPDLPDGVYPIFYADPPWRYEHIKTNSRAIENQYPTMSLDEICTLTDPKGRSITQVTADDSILFLWATNPKLAEAMQVIEAWGFVYRTNMVWVKDKIGMGYYARQRHELLLIATRGEWHPPAESLRPDSVQESPRGRHSEKPEVFYEIIESMYPEFYEAHLCVELFSRNPRKGWRAWGNEA